MKPGNEKHKFTHDNKIEKNVYKRETREISPFCTDRDVNKWTWFFSVGVPEKRPSWPIGFRQPFKPQSRFEVLQWEYFTDTSSYGFTEVNPKARNFYCNF